MLVAVCQCFLVFLVQILRKSEDGANVDVRFFGPPYQRSVLTKSNKYHVFLLTFACRNLDVYVRHSKVVNLIEIWNEF